MGGNAAPPGSNKLGITIFYKHAIPPGLKECHLWHPAKPGIVTLILFLNVQSYKIPYALFNEAVLFAWLCFLVGNYVPVRYNKKTQFSVAVFKKKHPCLSSHLQHAQFAGIKLTLCIVERYFKSFCFLRRQFIHSIG